MKSNYNETSQAPAVEIDLSSSLSYKIMDRPQSPEKHITIKEYPENFVISK